MFSFNHKIKPYFNWLLKKTGLYIQFHKLVIKLLSKREKLSNKFIRGSGIEIGALHTPLKVFHNAKVTYVDHLDTNGLRQHYPELAQFHFVPVGIVDDGENLKRVKSNSQAFVIANHFVEHCENPISMLKNHLRVLKKSGIIFCAIPDKRFTFDSVRPLTTITHLERDYEKGPQASRKGHYEEWKKLINTEGGGLTNKSVQQLMEDHYSIHFHTWTMESFINMLEVVKKKYSLSFKVIESLANINEFIIIMQKI